MKVKKKKIIILIVILLIFSLVLLTMYLNNKNVISKLQTNQEQMNDNIEITYKKTKISADGKYVTILLTVEGDNKIEKIITPDKNEIYPQDKTKISLDYILNSEEDYEFKAVDVKGIEKNIIINVTSTKIYKIEDLEDINVDLTLSYTLINDLDFKDRNSYRTQEKYEYYTKDEDGDGKPDNSWEPIGKATNKFSGYFYGGFHKISNLYINTEKLDQSYNQNIGFFACIDYYGGKVERIDFRKC